MTLEALAIDYFKAAGELAGGSVFRQLLGKRAEAARDILVDRLQKAKATLKDIPEDEAAAITYRYMRAAEEGAARVNLKLLADVIVGQDAKPGFYANDFLLWADIISSLRHEEIVVLGTMQREAALVADGLPSDFNVWARCQHTLLNERGISFPSSDALAAALLRTGLVTLIAGTIDGGPAYAPTADLQKLAEMSDLESYYMEESYVA